MISLLPAASMDVDSVSPKKDMNDVACVVLFRSDDKEEYYIYLINVTTQELKGILHLRDGEYPSQMGFIVYESMLYMFGGIVRASPKCHLSLDAFVLDLFELANAGNEMKPKPTKLPQMNSGKKRPIVVAVGHLILVFGYFPRESAPPHSRFEVYDPKQKSWYKIQDPCVYRLEDVDAYHVRDNKVFLAFANCSDIHILDLNTPSSPTWSHVRFNYHAQLYYSDLVNGVNYGQLLICSSHAYDFGKERSFGSWVSSVILSGKTGNKGYYVDSEFDGGMMRFGSDKLCTITPQIVRKAPRRRCNLGRLMIGHRKPLFLGKEREVRKCRRYTKSSFRFLVNVCSVDLEARPIQLQVINSFSIPMYVDSDVDIAVWYGDVTLFSLCNPSHITP